jgi:FMN reductase
MLSDVGFQVELIRLLVMRTFIHALRGWPTPLGVSLNPSASPLFDAEGEICNPRDAQMLAMLAGQVVEFARMKQALAEHAMHLPRPI